MQRVVLRKASHGMPTMGRLFGGAGLAATGYLAGAAIVPLLPQAMKGAAILPVVAASFGLLIGWRVIGRFPGKTMREAVLTGLKAASFVLIWAMIYLGLVQMLRQAMRNRYDSVTEAVVDILNQGLQFAIMAAHPMVLGSLLVGGALSGMVALWGHRKLR
ncbi:TrgA family protein [Pseudothioclava arenosa]|uniref:Tellurium resistance protein n=1 Tax=Pseudothioclava arenosa TaxID=1795308 RepID=A0A2A4CNM2_9RHOB|nr:TrgA family protein [Pseudothioclava arenosa]PCD75729.1 hypothetical protein CLN94_12530 [Pseudothioclava arenosa]